LWGGASGIGLAAGPVLGGILTAALGWRAIFLVNLPIAAAAGELLRRHVGETPRHRHPLDLPGQILATAGLAALTGGFIIAGSRGWDGRLTLALLAAGIASAEGSRSSSVWSTTRWSTPPSFASVRFRSRSLSG
jgi:DHA2 family methylenomycin A resistance protein-like MFS transporter